MMMDKQRERFENYLREFEPRQLRPLPGMSVAPKVRRVAAGIVLVAACVGSLWVVARNSPAPSAPIQEPETSLTARELLRLAMEDAKEFDAALTAASRRILPRFDGNDSTLRVLAKE